VDCRPLPFGFTDDFSGCKGRATRGLPACERVTESGAKTACAGADECRICRHRPALARRASPEADQSEGRATLPDRGDAPAAWGLRSAQPTMPVSPSSPNAPARGSRLRLVVETDETASSSDTPGRLDRVEAGTRTDRDHGFARTHAEGAGHPLGAGHQPRAGLRRLRPVNRDRGSVGGGPSDAPTTRQ